jgi:solute:Na+ symporter, SSS family
MVTKYTIISIFLFILAIVAYFSYKRINNYQDYNLAGRNTGLFALTGTLVAAEFNTATLIGGASVAYLYGYVGVWYTAFLFVPTFLVYAFTVAKKYRRMNISTIAEFFDERFSGKLKEPTRAIATIIMLSFTWLAPATYLAGISVVGNILLGVSPLIIAVSVICICLLLSLAGGLMTAIWTDVTAFIMIIIGIPTIFFIGWHYSGGFAELSNVFEAKFLSFKPVWDIPDYNFKVVLAWYLQITLLYIAAPWYGQRVFSAKNEKVAYKAMLINTVLLTLLYGMVAFATMFSKVLHPNLTNPEEAIPSLILNYSPPFIQGILLVMLMLVGMSTIIAIWNSSVSIVVNDLIRKYVVKNKSENYYINISRLIFVIIGISTLFLGLAFIGSILNTLIFLTSYGSMVAIPILLGLYWPRYNTNAALVSMISGLIYVTIAIVYDFPFYLISPIATLISLVLGIIVAYATNNRSEKDSIDKFYELVNGK